MTDSEIDAAGVLNDAAFDAWGQAITTLLLGGSIGLFLCFAAIRILRGPRKPKRIELS